MSEDLTTGGRVHPIMRWDTPMIYETIRPVIEFGDELHKLIRDMFATMQVTEGVGLAVTQMEVGVPVFIYECLDTNDRAQCRVVCNPVAELPRGKDRNLDIIEESCLSQPGGYSSVPRLGKAIRRGQDTYSKEIELLGTGLLARCFQRETDHLNGTVLGSRISDRSRRRLDAQVASLVWRYPEDWPVSPEWGFAPRPGEQRAGPPGSALRDVMRALP